jgi:hypothetical protein
MWSESHGNGVRRNPNRKTCNPARSFGRGLIQCGNGREVETGMGKGMEMGRGKGRGMMGRSVGSE